MLLEHFYTICQTTTINATTWCIVAELNPEHPIVPGVCIGEALRLRSQYHPVKFGVQGIKEDRLTVYLQETLDKGRLILYICKQETL